MLSGKMKPDTKFAADDHRLFNRQGEAFDRGETFSGIDYEIGLRTVERLRPLVPAGWSCAIPGIRTVAQAESNCQTADLAPLDATLVAELKSIYTEEVRPHVHQRW